LNELIVGTICGGSDGTSGLTANPAIGRACDRLTAAGAACIFEETGELIGLRAAHGISCRHASVGRRDRRLRREGRTLLHSAGSRQLRSGNADGGLTTQEEKSMGAYAKSGASAIVGLIKTG